MIASSGDPDEATAELNWLTAQLDRLRHHITIRRHPHAHSAWHRRLCLVQTRPVRDARPVLEKTRRWILSLPSSPLTKMYFATRFAGHTHIDDFRVLTDRAGHALLPNAHRALHQPRSSQPVPASKSVCMTKKSAPWSTTRPITSAVFPPTLSRKPAWKLAYDFREESHLPRLQSRKPANHGALDPLQ